MSGRSRNFGWKAYYDINDVSVVLTSDLVIVLISIFYNLNKTFEMLDGYAIGLLVEEINMYLPKIHQDIIGIGIFNL